MMTYQVVALWLGLAWLGPAELKTLWHLSRHNSAQLGMAQHGSVLLGTRCHPVKAQISLAQLGLAQLSWAQYIVAPQ